VQQFFLPLYRSLKCHVCVLICLPAPRLFAGVTNVCLTAFWIGRWPHTYHWCGATACSVAGLYNNTSAWRAELEAQPCPFRPPCFRPIGAPLCNLQPPMLNPPTLPLAGRRYWLFKDIVLFTLRYFIYVKQGMHYM